MTEFEPRTSGIRSYCSTNWATTTAHKDELYGPDLVKFHHFDQYLKIFGNIFKVYLVLGKISAHFGTICMLLANLYCWKWPNIVNTIWSHWWASKHFLISLVHTAGVHANYTRSFIGWGITNLVYERILSALKRFWRPGNVNLWNQLLLCLHKTMSV